MAKQTLDPEFAGIVESRIVKLSEATRLAALANKKNPVEPDTVSPVYDGAARFGNNTNNKRLHEQVAADKKKADAPSPVAPVAPADPTAPPAEPPAAGAPVAPTAPPAWKQNA